MMKRTSLKYILIVFVLAVWGLIFYKIVVVMGGAEIAPGNRMVTDKSDSTRNLMDTFSIMANYPDPFLRRNIYRSSDANKETDHKKMKKVNDQQKTGVQKSWPSIAYAGLVSNFTGNKSTVMISINGAGNIMKKGDTSNEVELVAIAKDSVKLKFQGEYRYIKRYGAK